MPIPFNQHESRPSVKLPMIGAWLEVALVGSRRVPWQEFGTNQPKMGRDGKPRKQLRLTGIVVNSSGANAGSQEAPKMPTPGEVVDLYIHGHTWGAWIDAEKALKTAGLRCDVGDIVLWHYTHDEPSQNAQPRKVRSFSFRKPRPEEGAVVAEAERQYYALRFNEPDVDTGPPDTTDEPFPASPSYGQQPNYPQYPTQQQYPPQQQQPPGYPQQQPPSYPPQQQPSYPPQQPATAPPGYGQGQPTPPQPAPAGPAGYAHSDPGF